MKLKKFGVVLGLVALIAVTGCQSADVAPEGEQDSNQVQAEVSDHKELDFSKGFKSSEEALDAYMTEIIYKDYEKAYEALHEVDKATFSVEDFAAYQASMQLSKDVHGYSVHDEEMFLGFEFAGTNFEQVIFYDLDLAYVKPGEDPLPVSDNDDHDHDSGSDFQNHDHGHEMISVGLASVKRNGYWFVLQGLSEYELKDLTRKYTNQSVSLNKEEKESYALGEAAPVGNMLISVNEALRDVESNRYILDISFMNVGFDPMDTDHFVSKFAVIDSSLMNYLSQPMDEEGALNGLVRAGSYAKGKLAIPVNEGFETDAVYFLMNTIDPSKQPIKFDLSQTADEEMSSIYKDLKRKPESKIDQKAYIDGIMMSVRNVSYTDSSKTMKAPEGWEVVQLDMEISNLTDELVYTNQLYLTARTADGISVNVHDQFKAEKMEGVMTINERFEFLAKTDEKPIELTLCIRDTRPNNSVTFIIE